MGKAYYDVYDRQGNKLIEEVTSKQIGEALEYSPAYVAKCACEEMYLGNKYKIVKKGRKDRGKRHLQKLAA